MRASNDACLTMAGSADDQPRIFGLPASTMALFLVCLVSLDSLATVLIMRQGFGTEINPAMAWLMGHGEVPFVVTRMTLAGLCALWMHWRAEHPYARIALIAGFAIFTPVLGLHVYNQAFLAQIGAHDLAVTPQVINLVVTA